MKQKPQCAAQRSASDRRGDIFVTVGAEYRPFSVLVYRVRGRQRLRRCGGTTRRRRAVPSCGACRSRPVDSFAARTVTVIVVVGSGSSDTIRLPEVNSDRRRAFGMRLRLGRGDAGPLFEALGHRSRGLRQPSPPSSPSPRHSAAEVSPRNQVREFDDPAIHAGPESAAGTID